MSENPGNPPPLNDADTDPDDTLIVPPPGFRERLLAAQRARKTGSRSSVEIPTVSASPEKTPDSKSEGGPPHG